MNNKLKFGLFIFTFLLILFLFYRFTNYTEYLSIVPNSSVMTAIRPKRLYKIVLTSLTFSSGLNIPTDAFTFIDYTSKPTPSAVSTIDTGIRGSDFSNINIYNPGTESCRIMGTNLRVTPNETSQSTTKKVTMTIGATTGTPLNYNGDSVIIDPGKQIQFSNLSDFVLQRLTIICDNYTASKTTNKLLYIYLTKSNSTHAGIKINNLANDIIIIDLYK